MTWIYLLKIKIKQYIMKMNLFRWANHADEKGRNDQNIFSSCTELLLSNYDLKTLVVDEENAY